MGMAAIPALAPDWSNGEYCMCAMGRMIFALGAALTAIAMPDFAVVPDSGGSGVSQWTLRLG